MKVEKYSQLKTHILDILWKEQDFDTAVRQVLALVGMEFSADSVYVSEHDSRLGRRYLWTASGSASASGDMERTEWNELSIYENDFAMSGKTAFWSIDTLPPEQAEEFKQFDCKSVLQAPIEYHGQLAACFGLTDSRYRRSDWESDGEIHDVVMTIAQIIGVFLLKARYAESSGEYQKQLESSLKASQERANTAYELLDSISAGVILVCLYPDGRAKPLYGNLGMYRILKIARTAENAVVPDRSVAALEGAYFDDFFANIPEPDNGRVRQEYLDGFKTDNFCVKKYRLLCGDGTYAWVSADLSLRQETEECRIYYATYTDMTEEMSLQTDLRETLQKEKQITADLEKASRAKSDFLSRMSHDIRTPMNAIMGMVTIARSHLNNEERLTGCLDKIDTSSRLLLSIINEVLDMSKIESGRIVLTEESVNLSELVQSVVSMVQPLIDEKNLQFQIHLNDIRHEFVLGDMQRLQQLIMNLLTNAIKYTGEGGIIRLEIFERPSDEPLTGCYEFAVEDNGIGMRSDFLEHVFEPFERADDERIHSVQGTGLGLSICKSVAEKMGGQIRVESEYGRGSRFTASVYLKRTDAAIDDKALRGRSVLIADDDEITCINTCRRLEALGIRTEWVTNGREALEKAIARHAAGQDYFAAILDLKMPGLDGIETTRKIRENLGNTLPVILISAYDFSEYLDKATTAGVNGFITKPLFLSRLISNLKRFLEVSEPAPQEQHTENTPLYTDRRILLVEDNVLNQEIAAELLRMMGVMVDIADNGKAALEQIQESPPGYYDLIFMDMQMPVMDGCTSTKAIRALNREDAKTIPIIAMTANAFADDRQKTAESGMNEHLAKPIDPRQLKKTLERWL
ncbi:response regulator [Clostridium transplantifaecale]|uniref:response regulator n=1 Tax=Clostridium transplantifaecale TaxID=2479838 RepID=UPI0013DE092E|nr:response regulator [Clostridium transplantifaecale]